MLVFEKEIIITPEFLDSNRHVNNVQYVIWVEMMAEAHWDILKDSTPYAEEVWFLSEHRLKYHQQVFLDDRLLMKTYPLPPEGIRQPRKVEFYKDGNLAVDSLTLWVLIDSESGKIKRLPEDWLDKLE